MTSASFQRIHDFLLNKMRMAHVYQPVMIRTLLNSGGSASTGQIAQALLAEDRSQIEYYEQITKNMVGRVLVKNRAIASKDKDTYTLDGFDQLEASEVTELIKACDEKIRGYVDVRGDAIWSHRKKSSGYISGTIRYEVLKRAKFRCELCGISAQEKALEVDHIIPRSHQGSDDISNLQALCYSCNAMKRDRDDTDFRGVAEQYKHRDEGCIFCELSAERIIYEDELVLATRDKYPVTEGHTLIVPKRHVSDYFDLFQPELNAVNRAVNEMRREIQGADSAVAGFNVGVNSGEPAGQTVFHCHIHLIPRRLGDTENARGGVRGVIPGRQGY